jgi:hypothetical protein
LKYPRELSLQAFRGFCGASSPLISPAVIASSGALSVTASFEAISGRSCSGRLRVCGNLETVRMSSVKVFTPWVVHMSLVEEQPHLKLIGCVAQPWISCSRVQQAMTTSRRSECCGPSFRNCRQASEPWAWIVRGAYRSKQAFSSLQDARTSD